MAEGSESKTEKASPKKRRDERKKGNVFQSKDISTVVSILAMFIMLRFLMPTIYTTVSKLIKDIMYYISAENAMTEHLAMDLYIQVLTTFVIVAGPMLLTSMFVGIISSGVQTRFIMSFESIKPKFSNMSILKGIKRMFSMRSVVELLKSLIKVTLISVILYQDFIGAIPEFIRTMSIDIMGGIVFILDRIMGMVFKIVLAFGVLSLFDYLYQWWDYENKMKMSKQEQKEEYKHMEGDPQVKGKIKERQRKMAMQRMMQQVPTADVVIRNPTHYAVALRYDVEKDDAPIVVAKGVDFTALKIVEIAEQHGIPTMENPPLARALYKVVEPNMLLPGQFYVVIAEIMAWVYDLRRNKKAPPPKAEYHEEE